MTIRDRSDQDWPDDTTAGRPRAAAPHEARAPEIDAIRGWAALSVVCFHVFWETFGIVVPWLRNPYTAVALAGQFDVVLFFILSGDALSFPFFHGGGIRYLQRAALKRYPRLTVPIVVVTAVTALAMAAGLTATAEAGRIVGRPDWLGTFARFNASGLSAIRFAFHSVYQGGARTDYLPFLWTMPIELLGSFVLLLVLLVYDRVHAAGWVVAGLAWMLLDAGAYTGCFLVGLLLGRARADGVYGRLPPVVGRLLAPLGIVAALALAGRGQAFGDRSLLQTAGTGALLLGSVYACAPAVRWLSRDRCSQVLGRISYLLYLWHYVVLITMTSRLIVLAAGRDEAVSTPAALAIGVSTLGVSLMLSHWTLPIEGWARRVNAVLLRALWRDDQAAA